MKIDYSTDKNITPEELFALAEIQGWGNDRPIERNDKAIKGSIFIASARHKDQLIGVLRLVGDNAYCLHIADFMVHTEYQGKGIGTHLLELSLEFARKQSIGIDDNIGEFTLFSTTIAEKLYEKHGFLSTHNGMVLATSEKRREIEEEFNKRWIEEHIE